MPLLETKGAASAQGFGLTSAVAAANYIEDVFSTYLYTGNGSTQTITNGIDLLGKGGLVWIKSRTNAYDHRLLDTDRNSLGNRLSSNTTGAQVVNTPSTNLATPLSTGFSLGTSSAAQEINNTSEPFVSWTFRRQAKFFDVVTYTGNNASQTVAHNLGSDPGCVIIKCTNTAGTSWWVRHRSVTSNAGLLNSTNAFNLNINDVPTTSSTSLTFSGGQSTNVSGQTYVAYLFAHDAGGFGASGTDNVISCGSYTGVGSTQQDITLGYEPQWLMIKRTDTTNQWVIVDNMRGLFQTADNALCANNADAEAATVSMSGAMQPTATGFHLYNANSSVNASGGTYIYIAIRRGPMRTPTTGTSVYNALTRTGTGAAVNITGVGFPPDLVANKGRSLTGLDNLWTDRLRGATKYVITNSTNAESTNAQMVTALGQDGVSWGNDDGNFNTRTYVNWFFRRAPGFFDVVCYTGTGANRTVSHNLGVVPELMIVKVRDGNDNWTIYNSTIFAANPANILFFTSGAASAFSTRFNSTAPTSTVFTVGTDTSTNWNTKTFVAYLFATVAGVSKVFSYTGNGSSQTINCGFTGGSRFVLIKRTDSTGDWYVWDSARGIVAGNDPYLLLNSSAAEVTTDDSVDTDSTGFVVNQVAATNVNVTSATYIGLAIA
jgi:hypothetical protein